MSGPVGGNRFTPIGSSNYLKASGKSKNRANGSSMGGVMSPMVPAPVPTAFHSGQAFPFTGMVRPPSFTANSTRRILVFATNTGTSSSVVNIVRIDPTAVSHEVNDIPTLDYTSGSGGPTSARAMKLSISLLNNTKPLNRSGRVFTLTCDSRIQVPANPAGMTPTEWDSLANTITSHPDTRAYDGTHFGEERTLVSHVIDHSDYTTFNPWKGSHALDDFMGHGLTWGGSPEVRSRPMTSHWFVVDSVPDTNVYALTVRGSFYTRWSIDSVPGQSHKKIPTAPVSVVNSIHEAAEKFAGVLHTVDSLAAVGAIAIGGIQSGISAVNRVQPLMALVPR